MFVLTDVNQLQGGFLPDRAVKPSHLGRGYKALHLFFNLL